MDRSYRLGVGIVLGTVLVSAALCAARVDIHAGRNADTNRVLRGDPLPLPAFRLTSQSNASVTDRTLADRAYITSFIFTRCPTSCPRISATMKGLLPKLEKSGVGLVSLTVDPEHDTPAILDRYARSLGADPSRWLFLTGPRDQVYDLILDGFKVPVSPNPEADRREGAEAVSHSSRLALVAPGNRVVGYYDSGDAKSLDRLIADAKRIDPSSKSPLPTVNATLNGTCAVLLLVAWGAILGGRARLHAALMIACLAISAVFLTCYLIYHYQVGSVPFGGVGPARLVYFTILLSHTTLAVAVVPLIGVTVWRAYRRQFHRHASIAKVTFPIWLYVSVTGVIVYFMLYRIDLASSV